MLWMINSIKQADKKIKSYNVQEWATVPHGPGGMLQSLAFSVSKIGSNSEQWGRREPEVKTDLTMEVTMRRSSLINVVPPWCPMSPLKFSALHWWYNEKNQRRIRSNTTDMNASMTPLANITIPEATWSSFRLDDTVLVRVFFEIKRAKSIHTWKHQEWCLQRGLPLGKVHK